MAYTVENVLATDYEMEKLEWTIPAGATEGLLDNDRKLVKIRTSNTFLEGISTGRLVLYKDGQVLTPPEAIIGVWGAFFVENQGTGTLDVEDLGFAVEPGDEYDLSLKPKFKMRDSAQLAVMVGSGQFQANDGTQPLDKVTAIKWIFGIAGGGPGVVAKLVPIPDINNIEQQVFVYQDPERDKWLSTDGKDYLYGEPVAKALDWILMSHGNIPHADLGYTAEMDMTITGIRMNNTEVKKANTPIFIWVNNTQITPAVLTLDPGDDSAIDLSLNIDVNAGDLIRIRMGSSPNGLQVWNLSVTLTGRYRWTPPEEV